MGTFDSLMDLEILGDCSTSVAETETAEEELKTQRRDNHHQATRNMEPSVTHWL